MSKVEAPSATDAQLKYAANLGIVVPEGANKWQVRHLINLEVKRRGRKAMRELNPKVYDLYNHPRHGLVEVARVGDRTLKITLLIVDSGRKIVVDAMRLSEYERATS